MSSWLAILSGVGALGVLVQEIRIQLLKRKCDGWRNSTSAQAKILVGYAAQLTRAEHDASVLRAAIAELESDHAKCLEPSVVRDRLRRLLQFGSTTSVPDPVQTPPGTNPPPRGDG